MSSYSPHRNRPANASASDSTPLRSPRASNVAKLALNESSPDGEKPAALIFTLPFPPSANRLWRVSATSKGMHLSQNYAAWKAEAGWVLKGQLAKLGFRVSGSYRLTIKLVRPDNRLRDLDNRIKAVSDLLRDLKVVEDDSLCEFVSAEWCAEGDPCTVTVEPWLG